MKAREWLLENIAGLKEKSACRRTRVDLPTDYKNPDGKRLTKQLRLGSPRCMTF